jgi:hypothetical protein
LRLFVPEEGKIWRSPHCSGSEAGKLAARRPVREYSLRLTDGVIAA